jgi:hypothetical protein
MYCIFFIPVELLRHDFGTVVVEEGWTKARMHKVYKIDSSLRDGRTKVSTISMAVRWFTQAEPGLLMSYTSFSVTLVCLVLRPFTFPW